MKKIKVGGSYTPPSDDPVVVGYSRTLLPIKFKGYPFEEKKDAPEIHFMLAFDENGNSVDCWSPDVDHDKTFEELKKKK